MFDFDDIDSDTRGKELKRETLVELAEYVNTPVGQKIFTEAIMPDIVGEYAHMRTCSCAHMHTCSHAHMLTWSHGL
jgi:hypothetical protein